MIEVGSRDNNDVWPQVEHMGADYRWNDPDSVTAITDNRPLDIIPNLHSFHLNEATQATDLISQALIRPIGLLASPVFCEALSGFVVQAHESFRAEVVLRRRCLTYFWLHMTESADELIDYPNSAFIVHWFDRTEEPVSLVDCIAFRLKMVELANSVKGSLIAREIAFLPDTPRFDLFALALPVPTFFASPRLAAGLSSRSLTGFEMLSPRTTVLFE